MENLLLKNALLIDEKRSQKADVLIKGEKIASIGKPGSFSQVEKAENLKNINLNGKYIFPGIIDAHTHYYLKSRNTITADDFYSGSISAAAGGVTTVIDYIDFPPDADFKSAFEKRCLKAADSIIDYNFHQVIEDFNQEISKKLKILKEIGIASVKLFTTYRREGYVIERGRWRDVLKRLKELKLLPTVHAEEDKLIEDLEKIYSKHNLISADMHPSIRPAVAEGLAVKDMGEEALRADIPLYIVHVSSEYGLKEIKKLRKKGAEIIAETAPHYLLLDQSYLRQEEAQLYLMTPPLRTKYDNEILWNGAAEGDFQVIATDHCSFTPSQKFRSQSALDILPGIPGTETLLALIHHFGVRSGKFSLNEMIKMLAYNPARIFGLYPQKGSLQEGTDADITVFDPEKNIKLTAENLHSAAGYSPYKNFEVKGSVYMTLRRGQIIFAENKTAEKGSGKFIPASTSDFFREDH
ncbi:MULTISPECIES: amidohydrolase family protein [unclassified Halanaerobium]|uniref:amidohydrolase family protein n=1 Tax=unclassified Halanaerobium TaxID=2641197 RepID=UPI000DF45FA8|nr:MULTISPECIES: amidohydrolase family protein [unclassified Halanaerobium]RCW50651.1 dihydropyrimidinase [Halanaerobium sp. MA284_MarDTE_T2]RCW86819.1 dihydropyrimidinase [Halanaerobium sp. DL-01]